MESGLKIHRIRHMHNQLRSPNKQAGLPDVFFKPKSQIWVNFGGSCNGR
jgi:hypothetical protein